MSGAAPASARPALATPFPTTPSPDPSATATGAPAAIESREPVHPDETASPAATPSATPAPLALAKNRLQLNPGGSSTIPITGGLPPYVVAFGTPSPQPSATPPLPASASPLATGVALPSPSPSPASALSPTSPLATATIDPIGQNLIVEAAPPAPRGERPPEGTTFLTVTDAAGTSVTASLLVGPNAGFVPATIRVALVGNPSPDFTTVQIDAAIRRASGSLPGAGLVIGAPQNVPSALPQGQTVVIPVKVHLDGRGQYVDVDAMPNVEIATASAPPIVATTLFYSDDPENVSTDGILFRGTVTMQKPARLYYYHQALTPGHQIAIVLDTPDGSAQVTVVGHGAGPNPAVFFVGQNATYRYLEDHARGAGVALDIPVGAPVIIGAGDGPLNMRDLVAGIFDIAVTTGDPVRLTVLSYTPGTDPRTLLDGTELPTDGYHRRGEYDLSLTTPIVLGESLVSQPSPSPDTTVAPSPEPTVIISKNGSGLPNLRPGGRALGGDYGLIHPITLTLGNDTDVPGMLYLYEQPVTGYPVTTSIAFDGDPVPLKLQCVKTRTNRYLVRAFAVQPHATVAVTGSYMTDGGSTYPIVFGLTATPPSPLPITMTEPDGCFPKPAAPAPAPAAVPTPAVSPAAGATPAT